MLQAVKDRATALVTRVLTSFKTSDVESAVQSLSDDEVDLLMKYVYKAMDIQADNATCQYLLSWHAQVSSCFMFQGLIYDAKTACRVGIPSKNSQCFVA